MRTLLSSLACLLPLVAATNAATTTKLSSSNRDLKATANTKTLLRALKKAKSVKQAASEEPFNPETDDEEYPGVYPMGGDEDLVINIREDDFPNEIGVNTRVVFSASGTSISKKAMEKTFTVGSGKQGAVSSPMERGIMSIPIDYFNLTDTLYQIEVTDSGGDGICCGESGNGWITVTGLNDTVLWSAIGDYTYVSAVFLYKDALGNYEVHASTNTMGGGSSEEAVEETDEPDATPPLDGVCAMCPTGNTSTPDKAFILGDDEITCQDMAEIYATGLSDSDCASFEADGVSAYYRALCNCPGYEPSCALCKGNPVEEPEKAVPRDEDDDELSCSDFEIYFLTLPSAECGDWDSETTDALEDFCGCPPKQK